MARPESPGMEFSRAGLSVPLETIYNQTNRDSLFARVVGYFEEVSTGIDDEVETAAIPEKIMLMQNYPNPFNASTEIEYFLPESERVSLKIYNLRGQTIRTLFDMNGDAGAHTVRWNGRDDAGRGVATGIYISVLRSTDNILTSKMTLLR